MSVQKISSFKTFTELKSQQTAAKLHEEGKAKRAEIVSKIGAALEEMGVTSLQELDEEKRNSLISKIFNEDRAEDIEKKIVGMGKPEEENPEKGKNLTNEAIINEGTRSQVGKIDKTGKITSVYVHWDGYPENMVPLVKNYDKKKLDQLLKLGKAGISYLDKEIGDKPMDFSNPDKGITLFYGRDRGEKGNMEAKGDTKNLVKYLKDVSNKAGAEYVYLYDEKDGKWYMADTYEDKALKPVAESFLLEGNAFGAAIVKAKEEGAEEFEVGGKKYKVKEDNSSEIDAINDIFEANYNVSKDAIRRMDGLVNIKDVKSLITCVTPIVEDLINDGFYMEEIGGFVAYKVQEGFKGTYENEERKTAEVSEKKSTKEDLLDQIEKLRLDSNAGKITGDQFLDKFMPLWKEFKSLSESVEELVEEGRSINKIQGEWTKVTNAMKATAAEWKAAEGDAKTTLLDTLKKMTAQKKALEAELDAVVADKDKDLELAMESLEIKESKINEEDITTDEQFEEYAMAVLKKAFGADFDEAKAKEAVAGILKKCDGDYGACVGMLTSSLGESVTNEATVEVDAVDPKSKGLAKLLKKHNVSMEVIKKGGPTNYPEVRLTGDVNALKAVLKDDEYGWDDEDLADYIEESNTEN